MTYGKFYTERIALYIHIHIILFILNILHCKFHIMYHIMDMI